MDKTLEITADPAAEDLKRLHEQLSAFNDSDVGPEARTPIAVFVRNSEGTLTGGISGYTAWGWLYMQWLWVDETMRGQRLAGQMLEAAEQEAIARGCIGALIDTFNPKAAKAYERQGYKPFGVLPDFPIGRSRIYLQKRF
ncbi:MAG: GNAT family N-acetyltransferase [Alphaproteobacteria bacterium]|nr:GNAT family N-acetyltransferase [Alphaproteobacteria bacterium]